MLFTYISPPKLTTVLLSLSQRWEIFHTERLEVCFWCKLIFDKNPQVIKYLKALGSIFGWVSHFVYISFKFRPTSKTLSLCRVVRRLTQFCWYLLMKCPNRAHLPESPRWNWERSCQMSLLFLDIAFGPSRPLTYYQGTGLNKIRIHPHVSVGWQKFLICIEGEGEERTFSKWTEK